MEWLSTDHIEPRSEEEEEAQEDYARALWLSVSPWLSVPNAEMVFWSALSRWHALLRENGSSAYNVRGWLYEFLDACGIRIGPSDAELMVGLGLASQIIRRVEEIHRRRLHGQKRRSALGVVTEAYYALLFNHTRFGESIPVSQHADGVVLTTVHQAKGLEWPIVCLPMLNSGRFPLPTRPYGSRFPSEVTKRYGTHLDDERRLFYVAVTRARERLFVLDSVSAKPTGRSVFLRDLDSRGVLPEEGLAANSDPCWRIAKVDLRVDSDTPIRVSLSDVLLYLECPYQFGLRRIAGLQPAVGDELGFGKGLHELLQRRVASEHAWRDEEVRAQVESHVHLPLSSAKAERNARLAISRRLSALESLGAFPDEVWQELPVEIFLDGGVVTGIIDCVYTRHDGTMVVRDWKANIHDAFLTRYTRQVQIYVHALRLKRHTVTRAELVDVAASARARRLVAENVDITESTIALLLADCQEALYRIREGMFNPTPSALVCVSCDVRRLCAVRTGDNSG